MNRKVAPVSKIIMYKSKDGQTHIEVRFEDENVWLTQKLIAELSETTTANINIHLKNIFYKKNSLKIQLLRIS